MLLRLLLILALFLTLAHAAPLADPFAEPHTSDPKKIECIYDGCECDTSFSPGIYCGYCSAVKSCTVMSCSGNVYQCGDDGECCNYGVRISCKKWEGPCGRNKVVLSQRVA